MLPADPLSEVLALLSAKSLLSASLRARGAWSVRFAAEAMKFNAVVEGACLLIAAGQAPIRLEAGDCFLLTDCGPFVLCSDPAVAAVDAHALFASKREAAIGEGASGADVIGGRIALDEADAGLLRDGLPPVFVIRGGAPGAPAMRWLLARLGEEWSAGRPGAALAADHLAQLLFVEIVRAWLASAERPPPGALRAIADPRIGAALRLLHGDPARRWRLGELAAAAGMSRSNFALRFKQVAGLAPLDYLLRWRMRLGAKALRAGAEPVAAIAFGLGYLSESAFSNAFKRVAGMAPRRYRRERG